MSSILIESEVEAARRPIAADEYFRLAEGGCFDGERIELVEGEILRMSPIGNRHYWIVNYLMRELVRQVDPEDRVTVQSTLPLDAGTVVEPDIVLLREGGGSYRDPLPGPADVVLVVEVADTTIRYDRRVKARLYARAGIVEYWVVDVEREVVIVHREPDATGYASVTEHAATARVALSAPGVEGLAVDFSRVFR